MSRWQWRVDEVVAGDPVYPMRDVCVRDAHGDDDWEPVSLACHPSGQVFAMFRCAADAPAGEEPTPTCGRCGHPMSIVRPGKWDCYRDACQDADCAADAQEEDA